MSATPTGVTPSMVWYYKEQAAQGNSAAILNLAVCYLSGVGMLKDFGNFLFVFFFWWW